MEENLPGNSTHQGVDLITKLYNQCKQRKKSAVELNNLTEPSSFCSVVFDGYLCWGPTKANTTDVQQCPSYVIGFDGKSIASKECLANGTWYKHPDSDKVPHWTNYTDCVDRKDFHFRQSINDIYFYGYCVSLSTLIISLIIFLSFRSLRCTRIRIHVQLFTSLALSCMLWIVWYKFVIIDPNKIANNSRWCIGLHIALQYLMICNYFWMFCEGLHLHLVLVVVFIKDNVAMRIFLVIGWILPLIIVVIYGVLRSQHSIDNKYCWIEESLFMWILTVPVIISFICSIIFLINIVRVLITKLHPKSVSPPPLAMKKAVRAALILIPLFGLQHVLLPFRPENGSSLESIYHGVSAVIISLQGLVVSCIFCFANHEVIIAVLSYLNSLLPNLFKTSYRESYYAQGPTTTRDIVL